MNFLVYGLLIQEQVNRRYFRTRIDFQNVAFSFNMARQEGKVISIT